MSRVPFDFHDFLPSLTRNKSTDTSISRQRFPRDRNTKLILPIILNRYWEVSEMHEIIIQTYNWIARLPTHSPEATANCHTSMTAQVYNGKWKSRNGFVSTLIFIRNQSSDHFNQNHRHCQHLHSHFHYHRRHRCHRHCPNGKQFSCLS